MTTPFTRVLKEEIGHYVDAQINQVDSAGDEGAIFAELVEITSAFLLRLRGFHCLACLLFI